MNSKLKNIVTVAAAALSLAVLGAVAVSGHRSPEKSAAVEELRIAILTQVVSALFLTAEEEKLFQAQSLDVKLTRHTLGKQALEALLNGEVDLAITTDLPLAITILDGKPVELLATVFNSSAYQSIIAPSDRQIRKLDDLRGKRIGVAFNTSTQYYLESLLASVKIGGKDVELINMPPQDVGLGFQAGKIDAAMVFPPHRQSVRDLLGGNLIELLDPAIYSINFYLVARKGFAQSRADAATRLMKALMVAEASIRKDHARALGNVAVALGKRPGELDDGELIKDIRLSLGQDVVISLEDHLRWLLARRDAGSIELPNVLNHIFELPLVAAYPAAVRLIR